MTKGGRPAISLVDPGLGAPALARLAASAERAGYGTVWTNETPGRDGFAVLGAWAAATTTARLGIGVVPVYARPPLTAAAAAAGLAEIAGDRVVLGVGSGHAPAAETMFGMAFPPPLAAVRDYTLVTRRLLSGERVTYAGPVYRVSGAQLVASPGRPVKVLVAAMGPRMLETAAEVADGVLLNWSTAEEMERAAAGLRAAAGGDFEVSGYVRVAVDDDRQAARRALAMDMAGYLRLPAYASHLARQGFPGAAEAVAAAWARGGREVAATALPDEVLDSLGVAGTADECRRGLAEYRRPGIDEVVVRPVPVGDAGLEPALRVGAPQEGE